MSISQTCRVLGAWRITGSDLWDRDYLDLTGPAKLSIKSDGQGEIAFGAMQASLDLEYGREIAFFRWYGFDEMDEVTGSGSAELLDDGTLVIAFVYDNGDEAIITAIKENFSTAC